MTSPAPGLSWFAQPTARAWTCAPAQSQAQSFHQGLPGYAPTPLTEVPALAAELGAGRVFVKDESARMGLAAFKVLGASWAVHRILSVRPGHEDIQLVTASDGNHGRALAWMARRGGQHARVFVPSGVHPDAIAAIQAEGAQVTPVDGSYDEAVRQAAKAAREPAAVLVQDTAWGGYEQVPGWIVEGYATLFAEIDAQLDQARAAPPGLVVIPAGVGSLAQAGIVHYRGRPSSPAPALMTVEPTSAAGILASLVRGEPVTVPTATTAMAGLNCGTPSALAWSYLSRGLDAAVAVSDGASTAAARDLTGYGIPAGPCGGAALAGARAALTGTGSPGRRAAMEVSPATTVVLLSTEGAAANPVPALPVPALLGRGGYPGPVEGALGGSGTRHGPDRAGSERLTAV